VRWVSLHILSIPQGIFGEAEYLKAVLGDGE